MPLPPSERLGLDIAQAESALMAAKSAALRPHGLTVAQYATLLALREHPGISGAGLARACLVTPQATSSTLKTLLARGLVARTRDDWNRTGHRTTLTDEGHRVLAAADEDASAIEERMYGSLSQAERRQLRDLLARCRQAL